MEITIGFGTGDKNKNQREYKGKNLLSFENNYVVLDLETTGFDPRYDEIIEIGAIKVIDGKIVDTFQTLVKPEDEIDDFISELTGITNEMLANAPKIEDVFDDTLDFIGDNIIIGHNVHFDINFLYDNSMRIKNTPLTNNMINTLRISKRLIKDVENHKLVTLSNYFNINSEGSHRALKDCEMTYQLYNLLKQYAIDNNIDIKEVFKSHKAHLKANDIKPTETSFDETHALYGKVVVFTGKLDNLLRKEAMQLAVNKGAICGDNITKKTNFLVLGDNSYNAFLKGEKSSKHKKAEGFIKQGQDLVIISEQVFIDMLDDH